MPNKQEIENTVRRIRPKAKFVRSAYSEDFLDKEAHFMTGFFYVSLYDLKIDSNILQSKGSKIFITNSYLSSFAYNLFLCALYTTKKADLQLQSTLLKHNLKKFFAEQVYYFNNCLLSRGLLLETLVFEEPIMLPVFEEKDKDSDLAKKAVNGSSIMSNLVMFHEFGHLALEENPNSWNEVEQSYFADISNMFSNISYERQGFITELKCDVFGLVFTISQHKDEMGFEECLKAIVFGLASFAVMVSLVESAKVSAKLPENTNEEIDLNSIQSGHYDYKYELAINKEFIERMKLMIQLCEDIATSNNMDIYSDNAFGLTVTMMTDLFNIADIMFDTKDENASKKSLMLARALHNHREGMEYLYLNSRKFTNIDYLDSDKS